jgi:hypothetical protein
MKLLDPFCLVVTSSLTRLASFAPVRSHCAGGYAKHIKTGTYGTAVRLAQSAFPILATPGYCETLLKLRLEQGDRQGSAGFDSENLNRFIQHAGAWNYTVVPLGGLIDSDH